MGFTKDIIGTNESVGGINLFEKVQSTQPATPYTAGLMSATDKSKLDSLENYVHPDSGVVPGKYMQVDVNEQGHVVAGRELQNSTLEDYRIKDAYIDLSDNSIVLGSHRIKPITPSDKVRWEQIVDTPNTLKEFGVTDVALSDGTINIGGDLITPLTADSQLSADKITGVIDLKNIPVGAMERCVVVEDDTARFALTTNDVQKGDTVKVINPTPTMYMVVDENKLDSADGYVIYSAGNANSVPWSGITDKPDHYYELPPADINTLGGVIVGDNITVDTDGKISTHPPYVLPQATNSTLGGVKIGENILEQPDGTINISTATTNAPGVVKIGDNINIDDDGTISTEKYQLPTATNMRLGGVRIGKYLSVDSEGLLNATGVPITASKTDMGGVIIGENIDIDKNGKISVTLPTKTSELENDSEFITTENLSLHNNDENAHASKFEAMHGQLSLHNNDENAHASKFEAMHGQLVNVYNNVAEMKQSTRLKAGMAAKTLGYYSANDGGGAYYVIREKVDGDVDDGGSIHELTSELVAELIVENGTVNVKQFGAKGDGVHDDTQAIQAAIDYLVETQAKGIVLIPTGKYVINSKLEIDIAYVSIKANGAAINASNVTSGEALHVYGSYYPPYYQAMNCLEGFELIGAGRNTDTIGILFNSSTGSTSHTNYFKINIRFFKTGIIFGSHAYVQTFINCGIQDCKTCVLMPKGYTDYGERLSFIGCTLYNSNNAVEINNSQGAFFMTQTSIDYTQHVATVTAGVLFLTDCHIESSYWGTGEYAGISPFTLANNNGASLTVEGGILLNIASTVGYSSIIDNQNASNKVQASFTNMFIHNMKLIDAFSSGNGITKVEGTKSFNITDFPVIVSEKSNLMGNGDFANGTINDRIFIIKDTTAISGEPLTGTNIKLTTSNEYAYKGDYSLKATKIGGAGSSAKFRILCPIKPYLLTTFSFMLYTPNGMPGTFWVSCAYHKIDGANSYRKSIGALNLGGKSEFNDGFKRVLVITANNLAAPSWATHVGVDLELRELSSASIYVDDIVVNQI